MTTEREMLDRLNVRYGKTSKNGSSTMVRYTRAEHVRNQLGFEANRTADYIAVDLWGTSYGPIENRGPFLNGHEVKCSRGDWLRELKHPDKADAFSRFMHYWWLVVSDKNIVGPDELPEGWGLMIKYGESLRVAVQAPRLRPEVMSLDMHGALLRATAYTAARIAGRDRVGPADHRRGPGTSPDQ